MKNKEKVDIKDNKKQRIIKSNDDMNKRSDERIEARYIRVFIVYLLFYMGVSGDDCAGGLQ